MRNNNAVSSSGTERTLKHHEHHHNDDDDDDDGWRHRYNNNNGRRRPGECVRVTWARVASARRAQWRIDIRANFVLYARVTLVSL